MNNLEYKRSVLDNISASFCGAKWYNATIWLGSGMTTSCHHPPAHAIDPDTVESNPKSIHNTMQKKHERLLMQLGQRPKGCDYCWRMEDMSQDAVSDRVYKSRIYPDESLFAAAKMSTDLDVDLKTLEISFDRTCQFACSYCNPAFSTTWVKDIRSNGPYKDLVSDGRNHFTHEHDRAQLYKFGDSNPYVDAFFKWWDSDLHKTLQELRITGGEPLMSGHTWKLIDWFKRNQGRSKTRLAINSNLGLERAKLFEFVETIRDIPHLEIYTSNESTWQQAEYIRDGLDYDLWTHNVMELLEHDHIRAVHSMCTINALCLDSLPDYLDWLVKLKQAYGHHRVNFTLNILRFPSFQSPLILPEHIRKHHQQQLSNWLVKHKGHSYLHEHEINHMQRLIQYISDVKNPHSDSASIDLLQKDFKKFYTQYDTRRSKDFTTTFSQDLVSWYNVL